MMKKKYKISTAADQPLDATTITVSRNAVSFPGITIILFHKEIGK